MTPQSPFAEALDIHVERHFGARSRLWIPALLGIVTFFDSWDSIAVAMVAPVLIATWHLGLPQVGLLISVGYAGQFLGALAFGSLADRYGRLRILVLAATLMTVLAGACALAPDYNSLLVFRLLQGLGVGGMLPVCIAYLNEIAPRRTRGRYIAVFQFVTTSGFIAASLLSVLIIPTLGWRWMFGIGVIPIVVLPIILFRVPESPRWLYRVGRWQEARGILVPSQAAASGSEVVPKLPDGPAPSDGDTHVRPSVVALLGATYRHRTLAVWSIWLLSAFVSFGLVTWLPSIYTTIYHLPLQTALKYAAIPNLVYLAMPILVALLIDRLGRRSLAIGALTIATVAFAALFVVGGGSIMTFLLLTVIGQNAVTICQLILWPYTGEIYPTALRSIGLGWGSSWARAASATTPLVIGGLLAATSDTAAIVLIFGLCTLALTLVWVFLCKETKGGVLR